jgi:hypothetical protein
MSEREKGRWLDHSVRDEHGHDFAPMDMIGLQYIF